MKIPSIGELVPAIVRKIDKLLHPRGLSIGSIYTQAAPLGKRIPNVLYQTWKYSWLSAPHARVIRKFRKQNPDFTFEFYDDGRMAKYMEEHFAGEPILEVFRYLKVPAARADIWRYCILFREGGMYCDIDSRMRIPLRKLLETDPAEVIAFESGLLEGTLAVGEYADQKVFFARPPDRVRSMLECPEHSALNWFLAFEPGHPILRETIAVVVENFPFFKGRVFEVMWLGVVHSTGPLALTQGLWRWMEKSGARPNQCGIDFRGNGIFKVPGTGDRDKVSPHYTTMNRKELG